VQRLQLVDHLENAAHQRIALPVAKLPKRLQPGAQKTTARAAKPTARRRKS